MSHLSTRIVRTFADLVDLGPCWDAWSDGVPFRSPLWSFTWWRHYGRRAPGTWSTPQLCVLVVERDGRTIGIAPWFIERMVVGGRVLRLLGTGEICSDYLTLLSQPEDREEVAPAVAAELCGPLRRAWDRIDLDTLPADEFGLRSIVAECERRGAVVDRRPGPNCWRLALPSDYEAYLASLSKSHRKEQRQLAKRVLDTDRAAWHTARTDSEFDRGWEVLVDLHQRRRRSLGEPGCFASPRFAAFHRDVARQLLDQRRLRLQWLEVDGRPIAAEYHFSGGGAIYGYQAGVDPDRLDEEPGRLAGIAVVRQAIAEGFTRYDLLRGDEPYKKHWRAEPTATEHVSIVAPKPSSRLRYGALQHLRCLKRRLTARRPDVAAPAESATKPNVAEPTTV